MSVLRKYPVCAGTTKRLGVAVAAATVIALGGAPWALGTIAGLGGSVELHAGDPTEPPKKECRDVGANGWQSGGSAC